MTAARCSRGLWLLFFLVGCGDGAPPLDELPLRDALRADPEVVAALPPAARLRLAARLEAARASDVSTDPAGTGETADASTPATLVAALDITRERRLADPLVEGAIASGIARAVGDRLTTTGAPTRPLPAIEGEPAATTASLEARALDGDAGASVRALLAASGARRLSRVIGWPVGAIAIADTVYVNAAWLVALAPDDGGADGGLDAAAPVRATAGLAGATALGSTFSSPTAEAGATAPAVAVTGEAAPHALTPIAAAAGQNPDAGPVVQPPPLPPLDVGDDCSGTDDSCGADDGNDDSCNGTTDDGSDNSCNGTTDDGSDNSCNSTTDDGDASCQVSRSGRRDRRARSGTLLWLLAPLGFLLGRRP